MKMKLSDMEFIKLLPSFMREDAAIIGMCKGVDEVVKMFAGYADHMSTWAAVDKMSEAELNELAWELNIPWYEPDSPVEIKRSIIKDSDRIQQKLGTKWAVERVIKTYFGTGTVNEWFEYGGKPGHFKIESTNPSVTNDSLNKFLRILEKVKRKSAHIDGIFISLAAQTKCSSGAAYRERKIMTMRFGNTRR